MQLITSNFMPVNLHNKPFYSIFEELLSKSDTVCIATGYIAAEAMAEIEAIIRENESRRLSFYIVLGMHKFDGFTRLQYEASLKLHSYLVSENLGEVKICTTFPYHGKVYTFAKNGEVFAGSIGSSNLSGILDTHQIYETDILVTELPVLSQMSTLIDGLTQKASKNIDQIQKPDFLDTSNRVLKNIEHVSTVTPEELSAVKAALTSTSFAIPIKDTPRSNLNVFFGKGRENTRTGFVRPRHWYEVELIVSKNITCKAGYPESGGHFTVITDDGWKFKCNVNGDFKKNFRSSINLQILGRWLKGRLEAAGCLQVGELVTEEVLNSYGRNYFTLTSTADQELWFIDFSR